MPTVVAILRDGPDMAVIREHLAAQGIRLRSTGDAEHGWQLIRAGHADVILVEAALAHGTALLDRIADWDPGAQVLLPPWLLGLGSGLTLAMALLSGLAALRSLRLVEPITLLR